MMHIKTMEGLVGARTSINLLNTPFRVFKEARQKGDIETMKRAMGYVNDCSDKAEEYMEKADKGMKEDAEEAREKEKSACENAIRKRKEEREELEKRIEESKNKDTDMVEISEDGKVVLKENFSLDHANLDRGVSDEAAVDLIKIEPVIYTKTGEVSQSQLESSAKISVSV